MILQLFFSFIKVGMFSVGGGYAAIPLIQNQIVDTFDESCYDDKCECFWSNDRFYFTYRSF